MHGLSQFRGILPFRATGLVWANVLTNPAQSSQCVQAHIKPKQFITGAAPMRICIVATILMLSLVGLVGYPSAAGARAASTTVPLGPISCPVVGQIAMASVNGPTQGNAVNTGVANETLADASVRVSDDGRYVFFLSYSTNLVPAGGDTNGAPDLFRFDRTNCGTIRVSLNNDESQVTSGPSFFSISDNGNLAAFSGFVGGLRVRNIAAATTTTLLPSGAFAPAISGDGLHVAFLTSANLAMGDTNNRTDVYRVSLAAPTTYTLVSVSDGEANEPANPTLALVNRPPAISDDGRVIVWGSTGFYGLVLNDNTCDTNFDLVFDDKCFNLFQRDVDAGTTRLVTVSEQGATGPRGLALLPTPSFSLSGNGRHVAFNTESQLDLADTDTVLDVYVRDTDLLNTTLASVNHLGQNTAAPAFALDGALSDEGDRLVFSGANYTALSTPGAGQLYVRNLLTAQNVLASVNAAGAIGTGSPNPSPPAGGLSSDGRSVAFASSYGNLVPNDNVSACDLDGAPVTNDQNCLDAFVAPVPAFPPRPPLVFADGFEP